MAQKKIEIARQRISENAFGFLEKSVDEIEKHPKYSVIHFATAVELLLKARLMNEHWSLVVERVSDADVESFLLGKCKTVGPAEAIKRLVKVCGQNISKDAAAQFEKIAAHRNKMVHFYHDAGAEAAEPELVEEVVKEQCRCWFHLERLLEQWADQFGLFNRQISRTSALMRRSQSYLSVAFERLKPKIEQGKKGGKIFRICSSCGYEAAEIEEFFEFLFEQTCLVCGLQETFAEIDCPAECGARVYIEEDHGSSRKCPSCGHEVTSSELGEIFSTEYVDPAEYTPINCALCLSLGTVVQHHENYICSECLSTNDEIAGCGWCNELQMGGGNLEFSYYGGCEFCDGHAGWTRDD